MNTRMTRYIPVFVILIATLACSFGQPAPTLQPPHETSSTPAPALTPTETLLPVFPTAELPVSRLYAPALLTPGLTANVRSAPGQNAPIIGSIKYDSSLFSSTGNTAEVDNLHWIEIAYAQNVNAWVSSLYLTEYIPGETFCRDERIQGLLDQFKLALDQRDGQLFANLVSPTRGLTIRLLNGGNWASYTPDQVSWLFKTSYQFDWGKHTASGLDVVGSFPDEVEPLLVDVIDADYQRVCNQMWVGGASYTPAWPEFYTSFNFYALHRPGTTGDELNWRTWLAGFEYVDGKPYLMSLVHYAWEP